MSSRHRSGTRETGELPPPLRQRPLRRGEPISSALHGNGGARAGAQPVEYPQQGRHEEPVIGKFEVGQCFLVESCRQTPQWGLRCRVPVGDSGQKGYVIKYFSDKTGDYIVFRNQCR